MSNNELVKVKEKISYKIFGKRIDKNIILDRFAFMGKMFGRLFAPQEELYVTSFDEEVPLELNEEQRIIKEFFTPPDEYDYKYINFTLSFIALAARLIKVDGPVNQYEYSELIDTFSVPKSHYETIEDIFLTAYDEESHWEIYGYKILSLFPDHQQLHLQLMNYLLRIALADGHLQISEMEWLKKIAMILNFNQEGIVELLKIQLLPDTTNPHEVLSVRQNATMDELNRAYRELARTCHPDNLTSLQIAPEYAAIAEEKFINITQCYNFLKRQCK